MKNETKNAEYKILDFELGKVIVKEKTSLEKLKKVLKKRVKKANAAKNPPQIAR